MEHIEFENLKHPDHTIKLPPLPPPAHPYPQPPLAALPTNTPNHPHPWVCFSISQY